LTRQTPASKGATAKAAGYGLPVRITLTDGEGAVKCLVWRVASANEFGHDRRADRAAGMLLAYDDFPRIPHHIEALDVGAIRTDGELVSIRDCDELYLITTFAPGTIYADDLRRIAREGHASELDLARVDALARYLAALHTPIVQPGRYRRAIRDLVGHGEGIYGIVDGYPPDTPGAPAVRLRVLEQSCAEWRWHLRDREARLVRTHGDFHPFNVVFDQGVQLSVLDASRGCAGDAADDVTAMAVNFPLFAFEQPDAWRALGPMWHRFWTEYLASRHDRDLLAVAPPFLAWRLLVVCNPRFYPALAPDSRTALLDLAERALTARRLDATWVDELFHSRTMGASRR
jgi:hypothetical protein